MSIRGFTCAGCELGQRILISATPLLFASKSAQLSLQKNPLLKSVYEIQNTLALDQARARAYESNPTTRDLHEAFLAFCRSRPWLSIAWLGEAKLAQIVLNKADVPDNGAKIVEVGPHFKIAVFRVGDRVAAIDNRCPHAGAELGLGIFDGTTVRCPLHGFRVDVWKGQGTAGKPHRTYLVAAVGTEIHVTVPDEAE
ncbi:MAG TPA: Rieske 2Fe-2S domain-containing protein [Magnetospirillaceae bacterium]